MRKKKVVKEVGEVRAPTGPEPTTPDRKLKSKVDKINEKIYEQTIAMASTFRRMMILHKPNERWRFTFSVSLSAEPVPDIEQKIMKKRR